MPTRRTRCNRPRALDARQKLTDLPAILQHASEYLEHVTTEGPRGGELRRRADEHYRRKALEHSGRGEE